MYLDVLMYHRKEKFVYIYICLVDSDEEAKWYFIMQNVTKNCKQF